MATLPALAIQQPNVGNALLQATQIRGAESLNRLRARELELSEAELESERARSAARGRVQPAIAGAGTPEGATAAREALTAEAGILSQDELSAYMGLLDKADDRQIEALDRANDQTREVLVSIESMPILERHQVWPQLRASLGEQGMDVSVIPEQYSPEYTRTQLARLGAIDDLVKARKEGVPTGYRRTDQGVELVPGYSAGQRELAEAKRTGEGTDDLTIAQRRNNEQIQIARELMDRLRAEAPEDGNITEELMRRISQTDPITGLPIADYSSFIAKYAALAAQPRYTLNQALGRDEQTLAQRYAEMSTGLRAAAPTAAAPGPGEAAAATAPDREASGARRAPIIQEGAPERTITDVVPGMPVTDTGAPDFGRLMLETPESALPSQAATALERGPAVTRAAQLPLTPEGDPDIAQLVVGRVYQVIEKDGAVRNYTWDGTNFIESR